MGIYDALLLSEAAEEMHKLLSGYEDERQVVSRSLEGDAYDAYDQSLKRIIEKSETLQRQLEELSEQSLLT